MAPQIPWLLRYSDVALLLMRFLIGAVFVTRLLGLGEIAGGMGVAVGVLPQLAALGLILIMLGAIQKKVLVWHTGFWGKHGTDGWHYDLLFVVTCLVVATTGGGRYVLFP
jgi:putative oxidoreductase